MELELKHIAQYLPYGLKIQRSDFEWMKLTMEGVDTFNGILHNKGTTDIKFIKPILRPLSDLTKKIEHNGEKFVPTDELKIVLKSVATSYWQGADAIKKAIIKKSFEYCGMEKLFEWHFDVFGLIENGLAIDKNTLK